jgi:hypothetical protein
MGSPARRRIVAVCGDSGGAAAVAPVIQGLLKGGGTRVTALAYQKAVGKWKDLHIPFSEVLEDLSPEEARRILQDGPTALLLTGTSFPVKLELLFTKAARELGVPSLAVLDFWSNYGLRFTDPGGVRVLPDRIAIMDSIAREEMIGEGFEPGRLAVTGQPAYDDLGEWRARFTASRRREVRESFGLGEGAILVLFASQPFSKVPFTAYPGYTEHDALAALIPALDQISDEEGRDISLLIRPHPNESPDGFRNYRGRRVKIEVSPEGNGREIAMASDLVTGMTTGLLVEACYLGCLVVSIQPGLRVPDPLPTNRLGVSRAVYSTEEVKPVLHQMLFDEGRREEARQRLSRFQTDGKATERVLRVIRDLTGHGKPPEI